MSPSLHHRTGPDAVEYAQHIAALPPGSPLRCEDAAGRVGVLVASGVRGSIARFAVRRLLNLTDHEMRVVRMLRRRARAREKAELADALAFATTEGGHNA